MVSNTFVTYMRQAYKHILAIQVIVASLEQASFIRERESEKYVSICQYIFFLKPKCRNSTFFYYFLYFT